MRQTEAVVYEIREKGGERFYIGMTAGWLKRRVEAHFRASNRHSPFSGLDKNDWTWTILEECETDKEAYQKEATLLRKQVGNKNCLNKAFYEKRCCWHIMKNTTTDLTPDLLETGI